MRDVMPKSTVSQTKPVHIAAAEFRKQALELRKQGYSYAKISEGLRKKGIVRSWQAVEKAVKRAIADITREIAEEVKVLELERLDELLVPSMRMARNGNLGAIDRALKIMDRRAKYLGLDMSTGREGEGSTPEEFRALMAGFSAFLPPPPGSCGHELPVIVDESAE
jgi:hypothetical protein